MALECRNHFLGRVVVAPSISYSIAIRAQRALQSDDCVASVTRLEAGALKIEMRGANPVADIGVAQQAPWKFFPGILFARGRHIRVGENTVAADRTATGNDRLAKRNDSCSLAQREIRIAEFMAGVHDLDAN